MAREIYNRPRDVIKKTIVERQACRLTADEGMHEKIRRGLHLKSMPDNDIDAAHRYRIA